MPHVYASQVEFMSDHFKYRENVIISLHPHNDRGCAVADGELGLLAGADRVEGTLFGNGERTGNVDIMTLAINMFSHGVDPGLDFSNLPETTALYERLTRMHVYERQPYSGALVFAAFSGSHQDAIAKGMHWRDEKNCEHWTVPYLPIDPKDVGREYEATSSGSIPSPARAGSATCSSRSTASTCRPRMREDFGYKVKSVSDHLHKELLPDEIHDIFQKEYVNIDAPVKFVNYKIAANGETHATVWVKVSGEEQEFTASGNGRLDAVSNALQRGLRISYSNLVYKEHALEIGSTSRAMAYVGITGPDGKTSWGAGRHNDIMTASVYALVSAVNKMMN